MKNKKLVSVLTPCYNSGKFVHRLLDSILEQTYPYIEMIIIDDGSTDNTADVIKSYTQPFSNKGYSLEYKKQGNQGLSATINNGLKLIKGEYLVWPDSDDFYREKDCIEKMVSVLENSDNEINIVRGLVYYLDEKNLQIIDKCHNIQKTELFEDCLYGINNFWYAAGCYMIKTRALDKYIPGREIYLSKYGGQNWQLLLPLMYKQKCITIPEYLYNILIRSSSHSRGMFPKADDIVNRITAYENTIIETLNTMNNISSKKKQDYINEVKKKYSVLKLQTFLAHKYRLRTLKMLGDIVKNYRDVLTIKLQLQVFFYSIPLGDKIINLAKTIRYKCLN